MMSVVSFKGMLVKSDVTPKEDMNKLESYSTTSLANENESVTVYSLVVMGVMSGTRNLDSLYVGVPIIDTIGRNFVRLSTNAGSVSLAVHKESLV